MLLYEIMYSLFPRDVWRISLRAPERTSLSYFRAWSLYRHFTPIWRNLHFICVQCECHACAYGSFEHLFPFSFRFRYLALVLTCMQNHRKTFQRTNNGQYLWHRLKRRYTFLWKLSHDENLVGIRYILGCWYLEHQEDPSLLLSIVMHWLDFALNIFNIQVGTSTLETFWHVPIIVVYDIWRKLRTRSSVKQRL